MKRQLLFFSVLGFFLTKSFLASACPCGCGSVNQMSLFPGESYRVQSSYSRLIASGIREDSGVIGTDDGPLRSDQLQLSAAAKIIEDLSLSLMLPIESNYGEGSQHNLGLADPSFGINYTVVKPSFVSFYLPQIDLGLSYKPKTSKSFHDGSEQDHQVDVHSNGWHETFANIGVAWNISGFLAGIKSGLILRNQKEIPYGPEEKRTLSSSPGFRLETIFGYELTGFGQLTATLGREQFSALYLEDKPVQGSKVVRHTLGLATQIRTAPRQTIGFSYTEGGISVFSRNTPINKTFAFSLTQSV